MTPKPRITAAARVQRLLAVMQRAAAAGDEGVTIEELCDRFGLTQDALVGELQMATMIGADASPDYDEMPFEVFVEDGRVFARLFSFQRPMQLSPDQGLALVAAADALVGDDPDDNSPLDRALTKLARLLGIDRDEAVEVDLDLEGGVTGRLLSQSVANQRRVRFRYWAYGRDVVTDREVEPWAVFSDRGTWYLAARDVAAGEQRRFRLDRMEAVEITEEPAAPPPSDLDTTISIPERLPQVVLDLPNDARWVAETFPAVDVHSGEPGRFTITLAVTGVSWLERLLLRIGPDARVVEIDPELGGTDLLARAAERVLARYRDAGTEAAPR